MEFKKANRYSNGRPTIDMPMRGGPRRPAPPKPTSAPTTPPVSPPPAKTVNIRIDFASLPKIKRPSKAAAASLLRRVTFAKKTVVIASVLIGATGVVAGGWWLSQQNPASTPSASASKEVVMGNLDYPTVLPAGKSIKELGGWRRISPPGKPPVYAYADTIGAVPISVSQQPLPDSLKSDTDNQVAELAKKFNATTKITGTKAYLGTSAKGPQSVIFAKRNTLILIKSQKKISTAAWAAYINSFETY